MTSQNFLIYGATGYSGRLIVEQALARGLRPIIGGRDTQKIKSMATAFGLEWTAARLDDPESVRAMAASAAVLLNAAGPFAATSAPLIEACIATGAHYLDITGEAGAIETAARWHHPAVHQGVMLMPAVGYEVVASDCLAAHVSRRLPGARTLRLGYDGPPPTSRGSLKTSLDLIRHGVLVRREGKLMSIAPGTLTFDFDYGHGPQSSLAVGLGDVSSAFFSTGIPNIETYMRATLPIWGTITVSQYWGWLLSTPPWQAILKAQANCLPPGPSLRERSQGWATLVADTEDASGQHARSRLQTPEVYSFTAASAVGVVEKCLAGVWKPGFQTPSQAYGPDFVLSFAGVSREDL